MIHLEVIIDEGGGEINSKLATTVPDSSRLGAESAFPVAVIWPSRSLSSPRPRSKPHRAHPALCNLESLEERCGSVPLSSRSLYSQASDENLHRKAGPLL